MKSTVKEGAEKTKEGAEKVADKTKEGLSKTGEVITDSWITTRVHSKFVGEDLLKDSDINVDIEGPRRDAARHRDERRGPRARGRAGEGSRRRASG